MTVSILLCIAVHSGHVTVVCDCHMMFSFLQPTEEDKVLKEKVLGSCKQVGALKWLINHFTEIS